MKVRIYNNQPVPENPLFVVLSPTGDYGPFDLIQCGEANSSTAAAAFQAQYVKFGGVVYREQEYVEVLSKLGLVDLKPDTLGEMLISDKTAIVIDRDPLESLPADQPSEVPVEEVGPFATTTEELGGSPAQELPQELPPEPLPEIPSSVESATSTSTSTIELPLDIVPEIATSSEPLTEVASSTP